MGCASLRIVVSGVRMRPLSEWDDPEADVERERVPPPLLKPCCCGGLARADVGEGTWRGLDIWTCCICFCFSLSLMMFR